MKLNQTSANYFEDVQIRDNLELYFSESHADTDITGAVLEENSNIIIVWSLGTGLAKTRKFTRTYVMFALECYYCLASTDPIGPQHLLRLQISPVVPLPLLGKHIK